MLKILIPAVAALGMVAFAAQSQGSEPDSQAPAVQSTGQQPVMEWSVHHEGALAKLAYGVAHSDQLALMITCVPGDRTAAIYGDVRIEGARLTQASLQADPLSGGEADEARVAVDDPALSRLSQRGQITVVGDAGRFSLTADRDERRLVSDFLAYCSPDRA